MTDTQKPDTQKPDLFHLKCGTPVDIGRPPRSVVRRDLHVCGWAAIGLAVLFAAFGAVFPPLLLGVLIALATPVLWTVAIIGRGPPFNVDRRCPACRTTWKAEDDHKHARSRGA